MLTPFICGSFHHNQEDQEDEQWSSSGSPGSTPRKSRKSNSKNNPYSARGLDKFSELLAELEKRKQEIHSKVGGPEDMYVVRFKYSNSNQCVPLVIKLKDREQEKRAKIIRDVKVNKPSIQGREQVVLDKLPIDPQAPEEELKQLDQTNEKKKKKISIWKNLKLHRLRRPSYYVPAFVILILLFLLFFGRSVTILCTTLGWYMVPMLGSKPPGKKKSYRRGFSEIKMVSDGLRSSKSKTNAFEKCKSF